MVDRPFKQCYTYDNDGSVCGILYNDTPYYFNKNLQGDVISIINMAGNTLAQYTYDAWGKMLSVTDAQGNAITNSSHIALINPYRYRGYYFDSESNFYYLQTRYYDPETGRFISPDNISYLDPESFTGLNLYAYCGNNPVMYSDPTGCSWSSFWNKVGNWFSDHWEDILSTGLYVLSAVAGVATGIAVGVATKNPWLGVAAGVATFGALNNGINAFYYNFISDGESDLTSDSYRYGYLNRWERLDYAKKMTQDPYYNLNAWRYFSEYNFHMHAWHMFGWAHKKGIPLLFEIAKSAEDAHILPDRFETGKDWWRNIFYILVGLLGM